MQIRQAIITGQHQVEMMTLELDELLQPDEIWVETQATFISAGTELENYTGKEKDVFIPGSWLEYPWKPGYANAGIIKSVGTHVTDYWAGQRIFTFGPHASHFKIKHSQLITEIPPSIDMKMAAASRLAGVSATAI